MTRINVDKVFLIGLLNTYFGLNELFCCDHCSQLKRTNLLDNYYVFIYNSHPTLLQSVEVSI